MHDVMLAIANELYGCPMLITSVSAQHSKPSSIYLSQDHGSANHWSQDLESVLKEGQRSWREGKRRTLDDVIEVRSICLRKPFPLDNLDLYI